MYTKAMGSFSNASPGSGGTSTFAPSALRSCIAACMSSVLKQRWCSPPPLAENAKTGDVESSGSISFTVVEPLFLRKTTLTFCLELTTGSVIWVYPKVFTQLVIFASRDRTTMPMWSITIRVFPSQYNESGDEQESDTNRFRAVSSKSKRTICVAEMYFSLLPKSNVGIAWQPGKNQQGPPHLRARNQGVA
jgi:hypothetical protein